jgi:hypothetical protein
MTWPVKIEGRMKTLKPAMALIAGMLFFACNKSEKPDISVTLDAGAVSGAPVEEDLSDLPRLSTQSILDQHQDIIEVINKNEYTPVPVYYIREINIQRDAGQAWLVAFENIETGKGNAAYFYVFIIDNMEIIVKYKLPITAFHQRYAPYDLLEGIPGERIGESLAAVYDYSGDGFDEILTFQYYGMGCKVTLIGYSPEKDEFVSYLGSEFYDQDEANPPIKLVASRGLDGIQLHSDENSWYFYYWKYNPTFLTSPMDGEKYIPQ